jgi:hypothetical protein
MIKQAIGWIRIFTVTLDLVVKIKNLPMYCWKNILQATSIASPLRILRSDDRATRAAASSVAHAVRGYHTVKASRIARWTTAADDVVAEPRTRSKWQTQSM